MASLIPALVKEFGARYPELAVHADMITTVLGNEEVAFAKNIIQGSRLLDQTFDDLNKRQKKSGKEHGYALCARVFSELLFGRVLTKYECWRRLISFVDV